MPNESKVLSILKSHVRGMRFIKFSPSSKAAKTFYLIAAVVGSLHALTSLYWALGGVALLSTLGAQLVAMFSGKMWLLLPVAAVKFVAAVGPLTNYWPRFLGWITAIILIAWGGLNSLVGNLVLSGVIRPETYDHEGMIGHAWLWDPLFLFWGLALMAGLVLSRNDVGVNSKTQKQ